METKFTKGSWFVDFNETDKNEFNQLVTPISTILDSGLKVLGICDIYGDDVESKANAKLIASAPEMFEQLKAIREAILSDDYIRVLSENENIKQLLTKITE